LKGNSELIFFDESLIIESNVCKGDKRGLLIIFSFSIAELVSIALLLNSNCDNELDKLGPIKPKEKQVIWVFGIVVSLWIFRTLINSIFPGLKLSDTVISIFGAIALFAIPFDLKKGDFILEFEDDILPVLV
jgi:di/tricarboxylate transporter